MVEISENSSYSFVPVNGSGYDPGDGSPSVENTDKKLTIAELFGSLEEKLWAEKAKDKKLSAKLLVFIVNPSGDYGLPNMYAMLAAVISHLIFAKAKGESTVFHTEIMEIVVHACSLLAQYKNIGPIAINAALRESLI